MSKLFFTVLIYLVGVNSLLARANTIPASERLGIVEKIIILEKNVTLYAKLDTGASMSSLSAQDINIIKRGNKNYVHFTIYLSPHNKMNFIEPLIGYTCILKRVEEYKNNEPNKKCAVRPVIVLPICLKNRKSLIKFNLVDRKQFRYPMLIGVEALKKFNVLIDVNKTNLVNSHEIKSSCRIN